MKNKILKRTVALTKQQINEFLNDHIPYRYSALCAWKDELWKERDLNLEYKICAFEAALLHTRNFLQFLGLGINYPMELKEKRTYFSVNGTTTDEVKIIDLNGKYAEIANFKQEEMEVLARVYNAASKATAHLTYDSNHQMTIADLNKAIDIVINLLKTNLYGMHNIELKKYKK
jgi:hypothetical protein